MSSRFDLALPNDPALVERVTAAVEAQGAPTIAVDRESTILTFVAETPDLMLRSRVIQVLEVAIGPDWPTVARPVT